MHVLLHIHAPRRCPVQCCKLESHENIIYRWILLHRLVVLKQRRTYVTFVEQRKQIGSCKENVHNVQRVDDGVKV